MRVQVAIRLTVSIAIVAVATAAIRAQAAEPQLQLPALTQGATHETRTADIPGLTIDTSLCRVSDDATYGVTAVNPIKLGGDPMYLTDRSMRFLHALRGAAGEGLHFKRLGSFEGPDGTILDVYRVEHGSSVSHLYVDGYRSAEPKAPRGFVCGATTQPPPAGPDPLEMRRQLMTLAATLDATAAGPISLDADGSATHGVVFDHVRLVARAFATAAAAGQPLNLTNVPPEVSRPHFVVVAYPLVCDGRGRVAPQSVKVRDVQGNSPAAMKEARGEQIRDLVPGFDGPTSALAVLYNADLAIPGQVEVGYGAACGTAASVVTFPIKGEAGRITRRVAGRVPVGTVVPPGGAQVRVRVYFDFDGMPRFPAYAGGLGTLADAAVAAIDEFRADPPRVNGAPILQASTIAVMFQQ
jgi:hypothetical protein